MPSASTRMLELPFGNGITAAFIFLLFELAVFPVLLNSTSKAASVFLLSQAEKGKEVHVESIEFPFWSEGLLRRQRSHFFLLLLRIVCIAIPVYLETRLISIEVPTRVSTRIQNAFVVAPQKDWIEYQNRSEDPIIILRENSERIYDRCVQSDEEDWVSARTANVTYESNRYIRSLNCVDGTAKRLFRPVDELPPFVHSSDTVGFPSKHEKNVSVMMNWVEGPLDAFPPSPGRSLRESDVVDEDVRMMFEVKNVTVTNLKGIECFTTRSLQSSFVDDGIAVPLMCQNVTGSNVDYYLVANMGVVIPMNNETNGINANTTTSSNASRKATRVNGRINGSLYFVGRLQFEEEIFLNAGHFVNVDFITDLPLSVQEFRSVLRRILFSKADNITVSLIGEEVSHRTILDAELILIGVAEIALVLVFAITVECFWRKKYRHIARPNTVNGLSKCWASSRERCLLTGQLSERKVNLRLSSSGWENAGHCLEPTAVEGEVF